ncbi:nucleotide kinase [Klebsiella phage Kp9]|nr:nucleotide kinase [Klebsiella phage Kp9]
MTEREIQVVNLLVEQNTDRPDSTTCADGVICYKVACGECPLNVKGTTIGEVRAMDDRKEVESEGIAKPEVVVSTFCEACSFDDDRYPHTCKSKVAQSGTICTACGTRDENHVKSCPNHHDKKSDAVKSPSHYQLFEGVEAIEVIARSMTQEMFKGYCLGNILKYRLRAGKKSELATLEKDMAKATFYLELYTKHKGLCYDAK